jgi:hypothetical protein
MMNNSIKTNFANPLINKKGIVSPRPCTNKDLAFVYGINRRTFGIWLKPHAELIGRKYTYYYTQKQVELIFQLLGKPRKCVN